ncbi:MAG: nucleotide exchange factor GrpE [Acidaminobacteraceae bacterium]
MARKKDEVKMDEEIKTEMVNEEILESAETEAVGESKEDTEKVEELSEEDEFLKMKKELDTVKDNNLRLNAEFQNFKRRVEKEKADIYKFANERLMLELLPVVDNFERALSTMVCEDTTITDGIDLIKKNLNNFLAKNNVSEIEALDQPFDHDKHHAVMTEEKDGVEANIVIEEFQRGYMLNDKVIRHSMVKVSC